MSKGKILVVDDEMEIVKALSMRLTGNGYEVVTAFDALQATNTAIKEQPDVIVLDIGMPAGGGHAVAKRLRDSAKTCAIPIIYLTARTDKFDYKQAAEYGVAKYITKPFDPNELLATIAELMVKA